MEVWQVCKGVAKADNCIKPSIRDINAGFLQGKPVSFFNDWKKRKYVCSLASLLLKPGVTKSLSLCEKER